MNSISVKLLSDSATAPTRAHEGDAGFDLYAAENWTVRPGERKIIPTDVAIALPPQTVALIEGRSGLAARHGIAVLGGVIDSGYRDGLGVILLNTGHQPFTVTRGDRIAQLLIQPVLTPAITVVDELPAAADQRGLGGFGSTGR